MYQVFFINAYFDTDLNYFIIIKVTLVHVHVIV